VTRLLLDTRLVLWWLNGDPQLPQAVVERVQLVLLDLQVVQMV
jgi:PIN domain nuclease of toxin-antitoxin system